MANKFLTPIQVKTRLVEAGRPTTVSSVRRWCEKGFGIKIMGRWCIPEERVAELEAMLHPEAAAGRCGE
jgi:hypothetical protein